MEQGFYIISDKFFEDFPDPYLKGNKEENRPHYFAVKSQSSAIYWMIPMSSKIDKYKRIIDQRKAKALPCDMLHIAKLDNDRHSVFVIQDMFPVTEDYILRKYTICGNHLRITSEKLFKTVERKSKKVLGMIRHGVKFTKTQPDVLAIESELLKRLKNDSVIDAAVRGINQQ